MELTLKTIFKQKKHVKAYLEQHPHLKKIIHRLLVKKNQPRPTFLSKWVINPLVHSKSFKSKIYRSARTDIFPFNDFTLGAHSTVEERAILNNGIGSISIGEQCRIGIGSVIMGPVEIGDKTITGQHVLITGLVHRHDDARLAVKDQEDEGKVTTIGSGCFIGTNACVLPGISIGKNCVVGSGSVVTKNVPDYHIVAGNPAKPLKKYDFKSNEWNEV